MNVKQALEAAGKMVADQRCGDTVCTHPASGNCYCYNDARAAVLAFLEAVPDLGVFGPAIGSSPGLLIDATPSRIIAAIKAEDGA